MLPVRDRRQKVPVWPDYRHPDDPPRVGFHDPAPRYRLASRDGDETVMSGVWGRVHRAGTDQSGPKLAPWIVLRPLAGPCHENMPGTAQRTRADPVVGAWYIGRFARLWSLRDGLTGAVGGGQGRRVSPQWHLWVDSLPPEGAIGWKPSEDDGAAMRLISASDGSPTRTGAARAQRRGRYESRAEATSRPRRVACGRLSPRGRR